MKFAFEMGVNALESFLILDFLARYFGYRRQGSQLLLGFLLFLCISFCSISFFSWHIVYESYASSLQILINFVFCLWLLKGSVLQKAFLSAFIMGIVALVATFTALFFSFILQHSLDDILAAFAAPRMIAVLTSKLVFFEITRLILRRKEMPQLRRHDFFPLVVLPVLSIASITLMMYGAMAAPSIQNAMFCAVLIVIVMNILTYYLFRQLGRSHQVKLDYELLNLKYECTKENTQDIQNLYQRLTSLRHDIKNHLLCLSAMTDTAEIRQYIKNMLNEEALSSRSFVFSGNDVLDAILNTKLSAAQKAGIQFEFIIANPLDFMAPEDICVLFGNLLDNAATAAQNSSEQLIRLQIQPEGAYISIFVENSIDASVLRDNPSLHTTKADAPRHGYGIQNINRVIKKYQGLIQYSEERQRFYCEILLLDLPTRNAEIPSTHGGLKK